jgi:hypothetical protein
MQNLLNDTKKLLEVKEDISLTFIPFAGLSFLEKRRIKTFFTKAIKPFLFSKLRFPYQGIVTSLNCSDPAYTLEFGMDLSRLFDIPLQAVYVIMPKELRGIREEEMLKERNNLVSDFENIYKKNIAYLVIEGNPVKATLAFLKSYEKNLLILLYTKKSPFSTFQPHIQYLIAKKSPLSTLVIPVEAIYEQ